MPVVAHFIRRYLPTSTTFIRNQILSHKEFKPVIVYRELVKSGFRIEEAIPDIPILDLPGGQTWFQAKQYHYLRRITHDQVKKIDSFLDINKADVLHFHYGTDAGMFGEVLKQSKRRPSVVSFYGYDCSSFPKWYLGYGKHFLRNRVFNRASLILAMSNDMKKDLVSLGCPEDKVFVHYYGTDTGKFSNSDSFQQPHNKTILLTAGRLDEKKGHLFMIRALEKMVKDGFDDFEWIIAGDGNMKERLINQISRTQLGNRVRFTGPYNYDSDDLKKLFDQADIYVQPSVTASDGDKEGIPGTLIEAMAAGLPVISTHHAGIPEVLTENTGILIKEWDITGLSETIYNLSRDNEKRINLGKTARIHATTILDLNIKQAELEWIYDKLLKRSIIN